MVSKDQKHKVTVYIAPYCMFCGMAKEYLQKHGVEFSEIDVSKDPVSRQDMVLRSGQEGVPVIEIGGIMVVGFDKARIADMLGLRIND